MKIILEYDEKRKVEITTDAENIHDVMADIKSALIAYGFHPNTVDAGFLGIAEEIELAEQDKQKE